MTRARVSMRAFVVVAVALAVGLALAVSPYASSSPDGLEKVATEQGFLDAGRLHAIQEDAPAPDYVVPGVGDGRLATGVAGFAGTLLVFALGYGAGWALRRRGSVDGGADGAPRGGSGGSGAAGFRDPVGGGRGGGAAPATGVVGPPQAS